MQRILILGGSELVGTAVIKEMSKFSYWSYRLRLHEEQNEHSCQKS